MRRFLKSALAILPLVVLGSCSSDDALVDDKGHVADKSEVRYLRVSICNPDNISGSRAIGDNNSDYAAGEGIENQINTVDFYFYDDHKTYLSHTSLKASGFPNTPDTPQPPDDPSLDLDIEPGDNIEAIYHCNVPVTLTQGERLPAYVLCIVNAVNPNAYEEEPMDNAQRRLLYSLYDFDQHKYFGMNNSVYYGTDQVTGKDDQLIMATPFDAALLKSASELEEAANAKEARLNIFVERYAAKVTLSMANDAVKDYRAGNSTNITLTFVPEKWGMNAYEKSFYLIKCYRKQNDPAEFADFAALDGFLFTGWNRPDHHRSFWARTPAYFDNNYPIVTDDILDVIGGTEKYDPDLNAPSETMDGYNYNVFYSSYKSAKGEINKPMYVMETTLKQNRLNGTDMPSQYLPINSIPSVVLIGKYQVNVNGTSYTNKTFYTYSHNGDDDPYVLAANPGDLGAVPTLKNTLITNQNIVLIKDADGKFRPLNPADLTNEDGGLFTVEHPTKAVRNEGSMKIPGDIVTLQLTSNLNGKELYYYSARANGASYIRITTENLIEVNRLLYQNLGGAHAFVNGMAFFTAPVQHWGWHRENNKAENNGTGTWSGGNNGRPMSEWDWSLMKAGDFGIVRNHVYTVNVSSIAGLGTGILAETDPLLPSADKIGYNIHFDIFIQKWAVLPTQNWEW